MPKLNRKKVLIILLVFLPLVAFLLQKKPIKQTKAQSDTFYVAPDGDDSNPGTLDQPLATIQEGHDRAGPGDQVLLLPGTYNQRPRITKSGAPESPITIGSTSANPNDYAVIDRNISPGDGDGCIIIDNGASWITIENLRFRDCWEDIIVLENASYITVRGVDAKDGRHLVQSESNQNHHLLIENSYWELDERIWTSWDWDELHHGSLSYYNGGIYGGSMKGSLVIRNNRVKWAFNALQFWASGSYGNANTEIYGNTFEYCYDNGLEPEGGAFNLHMYHNNFDTVSNGILSVDEVDGGDIYFYGNYGYLAEERPNNRWGEAFIWKVNGSTNPLYVYHNSFYHNGAWTWSGGAPEPFLRHYNNAYYHKKKEMGPTFDWGSRDHEYDYDCTSKPFSSYIRNKGQEQHGLENTNPRFRDPANSDFRLQPDSPCIDAGKVIPGFTQSYEGSAPDIGAFEEDHLVEGPPFYVKAPPGGLGYEEKPRITRHRVSGSELRLYFSWVVNPSTISTGTVNLKTNNSSVAVTNVQMGTNNREVIITTGSNLEGKDLSLEFNPLPVGENGETATYWASTVGVVEGAVMPSPSPSPSPTPTTPPVHCSPLGDIDCSGKVNGLDFGYLVAHWGTADPQANLDDTGVVDATDALILLGNYGE